MQKPTGKAFDYDVAIVGCGPVGATLANLLALRHVRVLVLERETDVYPLPRAVHFDDETMRVFQTIGIACELEKQSRVNPGMRFVDEKDRLLLDWPRPSGIGKHGWHGSYRLHQPALEALLRESLLNQETVCLKCGTNAVSLAEVDNGVELVYRDRDSQATHSSRVQYVVGCDGANSMVRQHLGIEMEDFGFKERWLVVDVLLHADMPELGNHTIQYCSAEQAMTYCRNPGLRRRWEMALPDSLSDDQALDDARIWRMLKRWIKPSQADIERKAIYTFRSELAPHFRDGHIMIAGDAAHLTPPFMGQGLCTGIRDASNLAWKLAWCANHTHSDRLLDSYQQERVPHAKEYIITANHLGQLINTVDKAAALSLNAGNSAGTMASIAPKLGDCQWLLSLFGDTPHHGKLSAQPVLSDAQQLDDVCGYRFVLLTRHAIAQAMQGELDYVDELVLVYAPPHPAVEQMLVELGANAILVRPDRYVLATMQTVDETVRALHALSKMLSS